jgi:hypothetical protein
MIRKITTDELKEMTGREGLILQGCGGEPLEWLDGINALFAKEGILLSGDTFKDAYVFEYKGRTNILFPMDDVALDGGKLAMWRLASHDTFGGTWLSDYLANTFGITNESADTKTHAPEREKPDCPLIGENGNIFNLVGVAARTLKKNSMPEEAKEMRERVFESGDYEEALGIISEYVNITSAAEMEGGNVGMGSMEL